MSTYIAAYLVTLTVFVAVDVVWLAFVGGKLFERALGGTMRPKLRMAPAGALYLIYALGLLLFAVMPALDSRSLSTAFLCGGLLGLIVYATSDLTSLSWLPNWTVRLTLTDMAYGTVASSLAASVAVLLLRTMSLAP